MQACDAMFAFFRVTMMSLALAATFPNQKPLSSELRTFLLYKVWPVVFLVFWFPLVPMVLLKVVQFATDQNWDEFLDIMHMFILGCFILYIAFVMQINAKQYDESIKIFKTQFRGCHKFVFKDFFILYALWVILISCFFLYIGGCLYYNENLVPVWLPFVDNHQPLPTYIFLFVWVYEGLAGVYMFLIFGIVNPFIIVSTICICNEISYLIRSYKGFVYNRLRNRRGNILSNHEFKTGFSLYESESRYLMRKLVDHDRVIKSALKSVSRVNSYLFLVQSAVTVSLSCFVAFDIYYTTQLEKVLLKSSPILIFSYYLMFAYCWNGQQLTNKCEELYYAVYYCPWSDCPHSFKTSLTILMEVLKRPVHLTAGGLFPASFPTLVTCLQQSISYMLVLKALTPEKQ